MIFNFIFYETIYTYVASELKKNATYIRIHSRKAGTGVTWRLAPPSDTPDPDESIEYLEFRYEEYSALEQNDGR